MFDSRREEAFEQQCAAMQWKLNEVSASLKGFTLRPGEVDGFLAQIADMHKRFGDLSVHCRKNFSKR